MDLYSSISRRKSCKSYTGEPLANEKLQEIIEVLDEFDLLYENQPLSYRLVTEAKGFYKVKAPHYLIASGKGRLGELEQAGFHLQQLDLWLNAQDIGSVWLGNTKDINKNLSGKDLIVFAFGVPNGAVHRERAEYKRKPIEDITNAPDDLCMQAVHLAPSGMNLQPWYFEKADEKVLVYMQPPKAPISLAYTKTKVDMGIALCHYAQACKHEGRSFSFTRAEGEGAAARKGSTLFGEIS